MTKSVYLLAGSLLSEAVSEPHRHQHGLAGRAGTVALMMQANPALTPNMVKAILQHGAVNSQYNALTQGAGFLNSYGAVQLAKFFRTAQQGSRCRCRARGASRSSGGTIASPVA